MLIRPVHNLRQLGKMFTRDSIGLDQYPTPEQILLEQDYWQISWQL